MAIQVYDIFTLIFQLQSFDDLVTKMMSKENMKIHVKDKDGNDMGESVGPDYVVHIFFEDIDNE